jgi:hypothetical protein
VPIYAERRRYLQDKSQTFKIIKGIDRVYAEGMFNVQEGERTRADRGTNRFREKIARMEV